MFLCRLIASKKLPVVSNKMFWSDKLSNFVMFSAKETLPKWTGLQVVLRTLSDIEKGAFCENS